MGDHESNNRACAPRAARAHEKGQRSIGGSDPHLLIHHYVMI